MKYKKISEKFFQENRINLVKELPKGSCAIIFANNVISSNADGENLFKQNSNFFYLTGIEKPNCILLLVSNYEEKIEDNFFLFIPKVGEHEKIWEGDLLTVEKSKEISGVSKVFYIENFSDIFRKISKGINSIFFDANEHPRQATMDYLTIEEQRINNFKKKFPLHKFCRLAPILSKLRSVKKDFEIEMIKKACEITTVAFRKMLTKVKKCSYEYELEAEILYEVMKKGCYRMAYTPIIASGKNALSLHYNANHSKYSKEDLILLDIGSEYANYASDITRVIPASGEFSSEQSKIYDAVLSVLKLSEKIFKVGKTTKVAFEEMTEHLQEKIFQLGLIRYKDSGDYKKYFMHGMGHHLGLDTHDDVDYNAKLSDGMVFAIEPAIYIENKNIGIRLENNFFLKNGSLINICSETPIEREEIESIINN